MNNSITTNRSLSEVPIEVRLGESFTIEGTSIRLSIAVINEAQDKTAFEVSDVVTGKSYVKSSMPSSNAPFVHVDGSQVFYERSEGKNQLRCVQMPRKAK